MLNEDLAEKVLRKARGLGLKIATAESCTGGLVATALTSIAGSSDVFERGFVTYSNEAKAEMLGIEQALIEAHGAVSAEVAVAMAVQAKKLFEPYLGGEHSAQAGRRSNPAARADRLDAFSGCNRKQEEEQ